jgi:regulation of enolase protein 1 (concanavalin A-like superfamily)
MCKKLFMLTSFMLVLGLVSTTVGQPTGQILFEYWLDIGGGTAISDLTSLDAYPDNPSDGELRDQFDGPVDWADNYGARARGYLYPPADGDYTFWIAGDDYQELYLSTDDDPANAALIAEVSGWTGHLEWDKYAEQQSAPITLVGGQKYYIEALMKEGGGGDSCAAGWTGPEIGEEITVIDGAYLSPAPFSSGLMKARNPVPADGAVDVDAGTLEWTAGATAVSHVVYFSDDDVIDAADLLAESPLNIVAVDTAPGMTYYWRVDEVDADGVVYEGAVWSFSTTPLEAHFPVPADGAVDVVTPVTLTWTPGKVVVMHDLYLSTDEAAVAARDMSTFKGKLMTASYDTGELDLFTTYYWAVDEFTPTGTVAGPVWKFSTPNVLVITEGATTLNYDNTVEPYVSELALDVPMDMTAGGLVSDLMLSIQGASSNLSIDDATGTYEIAGSGADIWGSADQFHYVYQELTGDGTITARVVSNGTGSNAWAKGGVMIRETTAPDSKHVIMALTGGDGGGIAFQSRAEATGSSSWGLQGDIEASPPHWVRITRAGNTFTGEHSADGETWELMTDTSPDGSMTDPIDVEMAESLLIGLFVTSHAAGEIRTYTFDNVSIEGDVSGEFVSEDIDSVSGNSAEPVYVALEDMLGASATVVHANPAATQIESAREWTIPLSEFAGVDTTLAAKLYVGVGNGEPGGVGVLTVSDVRVASGSADIIWVSGTYDDNGDGLPDDAPWVALLEAQGYSVDYRGTYWRTLDDEKIAALNAAKCIIVSRNSNSGDYDDGDEIAQWNAITTPLINCSTHIVRSSRWKFFDSTSILSLTPATMVLADGTEVSGIIESVGPGSFIDAEPGNGTVLATGDGLLWAVEWEAGVEYYDGAGQIAGGPRMYFVAGTQESAPTIGRGEMNLQDGALAFFLEQIKKYAGSDVTVPGDVVKGVPDDGDWPGAEHPALAIDDNVNTKYLHFKGETEPTGVKITPLDGPTVVTGLTFTTANDAVERDPISYELSGSNAGIDGPYELIASGDIVDFAQETAWPRFTKNVTPILFANNTAYAHYQVMFPAVRDPGSANSMQIAEIELIGTIAKSSYTYDGDVAAGSLDGTWDHDNGSDAWDGSGIGVGNPGGASALVEDGVTFLRIQDIGDPRSLGISDPSNRKVYLTHATGIDLDGATLACCLRVATSAPLDNQVSGDPWPEGGIGYHIRDNGKGMIGICDGAQIISFSLAKAGEIEGIDVDSLVMNNLVGTEPTGDVDSGDAATAVNSLAIDDATAWNTFVINIAAGGAGTHVVTISANGGEPVSFDVTAGDGEEESYPYIAVGSSGTGGTTAFDVDYISVAK